MKWKSMTMPKEVATDQESTTPKFGRFTIEPLERGFGNTVGNALRRTLLSSIQGAAITSLRVDGVLHDGAGEEPPAGDLGQEDGVGSWR